MSRLVSAVLADTRSIQRYIFSSNKLKTNIGASYIVRKIFDDAIEQIADELNLKGTALPWDSKENTTIQMKTDSTIEFEIVFIGGGKAMFLLHKDGKDNKELAKEFIKAWTKKLLLYAPGIRSVVAISEVDIEAEENNFIYMINSLQNQLKVNQSSLAPVVDLPYTGLTHECHFSGKTADCDLRKVKLENASIDARFVSSEVAAKLIACGYSQEGLKAQEDIGYLLGDRYTFAEELENIGYKEQEQYIAVVHIDGNNMGVKFRFARSSEEYKRLSLDVEKKVRDAFGKLVYSIIDDIEEGKAYDGYLDIKKDKQTGTVILPIRPIIIGGDDITFICPGRLGVIYAQRMIKLISETPLLTDEQKKHISDESKAKINNYLSCCAGVAIVDSKYPFFLAYEVAEQACSEAKLKSREKDDCWLDFVILHGEASPELEDLRNRQYTNREWKLHYGPYNVLESRTPNTLYRLFDLILKFKSYKLPESCIKGLREVLTMDKHSMDIFLRRDNAKQLRELLADEDKNSKSNVENLWDENVKATRFVDAIEMIDYVILECLNKEEEKA